MGFLLARLTTKHPEGRHVDAPSVGATLNSTNRSNLIPANIRWLRTERAYFSTIDWPPAVTILLERS
jgi:hypothetical protein